MGRTIILTWLTLTNDHQNDGDNSDGFVCLCARMSDGGDTCAICLDTVDSAHRLECGHAFHAACLISWLRQGNLSCPCCRDNLHLPEESLPVMSVRARASHIRRTAARRVNAPGDLKRLVSRLRDAEAAHRRAIKERTEYRRAHRETLRHSTTLRMKILNARRRVWKLNSLLGVYECEGLRLPRLALTR